MDNNEINLGKGTAVISYLTIFGTIIAFFMNSDKRNNFAYFHIRQALGLWLTFFVIGYVVGYFDSWLITFCFWMFFGVLFIYGFISALTGREQKVPLVGDFYQKIFSSIGN